jgi:hypothetical protein
MFGDLPPSSSETRFRVGIEAANTIWPPSVPPVKATLSTPGWPASTVPVTSPTPLRTLTTPGGKPASRISSANRSEESGVCSAGFRIIVLPQASAGASFQEAIISG